MDFIQVTGGQKVSEKLFCCGFQKHKELKENVGAWQLKSMHTVKQTLMYKKQEINKIQMKLMTKQRQDLEREWRKDKTNFTKNNKKYKK